MSGIQHEREIIGSFQKIQNFDEWLVAVASREADKILAEEANPEYPNYTYAALRGNRKIVGHWNPQTKEGHAYSTALNFKSYGRKFKAAWITKRGQKEQEVSDTIRIKGSKGNIYEVAKDGSSCTCPGFTFRQKCKHVEKQRNLK
jgi:hypothetical protein